MAYLELEGLTKRFGSFTAVDHIDFTVEKGEMIALLGGSGCGKTTTLRMIAGFSTPTEGTIKMGGKVINKLPAHKRNIGMFFQNYALFPHLTTFENVAFGLKIKKMPKAEVQEKVSAALKMVKLVGLDGRLPRELSGGQQQRVALARAIVTEPALLLLDEPLSNLDAKLRLEMQVELKRIHREVGITTIIVTHDQEEAMSLADRVIVMEGGVIKQNATPSEVYNRPVDPNVADFMGVTNFLAARVTAVEDARVLVECGGQRLYTGAARHPFKEGEEAVLAIRPAHVALAKEAAQGYVPATVQSCTYKGGSTHLQLQCPAYGGALAVSSEEGDSLQEGSEVFISLPEGKLLIYPKQVN